MAERIVRIGVQLLYVDIATTFQNVILLFITNNVNHFVYRCDSIEKIRGKIDHLRSFLNDPVAFKNIYRYAYDFARVSPDLILNLGSLYLFIFTVNFYLNISILQYMVCKSIIHFQDKDQRSMDIDTAKAMLQLLLGRIWPLYSSFHQFLEVLI